MSMLDGLARMAKRRAQRRTEKLLDALPASVQRDIGWRWSPVRRERNAPWDL